MRRSLVHSQSPMAPKKPRDVSAPIPALTQLCIRIPTEWLPDIDALVIAHSAASPGLKVTRTDVARQAIALGIAALKKREAKETT
jgi:hypothetical protein